MILKFTQSQEALAKPAGVVRVASNRGVQEAYYVVGQGRGLRGLWSLCLPSDDDDERGKTPLGCKIVGRSLVWFSKHTICPNHFSLCTSNSCMMFASVKFYFSIVSSVPTAIFANRIQMILFSEQHTASEDGQGQTRKLVNLSATLSTHVR